MTTNKPYLIRAMYDWIVDNELTPYLVVDANAESVQVPVEYIENGKIILNISPIACRGLHLENDRIVFSARFSGEVKQVFSPPESVLAIYAKENGRGMVFSETETETGDGSNEYHKPLVAKAPASPAGAKPKSKKPSLKVVK